MGSLSKYDFDAEPHRAKEACNDYGDDGLERVTLRLLDTLPPAPQVLKISAQLFAVLLLNSKGGEDRRNRP